MPSNDTETLIGRTLLGRFEIVRSLGGGAMGEVFVARQLSVDRDVAVKVLRPDLSDTARERFLREARTISGLSHPGIVQLIEFGEDDGLAFIVLELVDGIPISDLLSDRRLHPQLALAILDQVVSALAEAHRVGIIHRDLKPANMLLTVNADGEMQTKLLDFGIAFSAADPRLTQSGTLCGTPAYMAPEQAQGREITAQTDFYALGVNLYQMLSGRLPFYAQSPLGVLMKHLKDKAPSLRFHAKRGVIPEGAVDLCEHLLKKERKNRPESTRDLRHTLARLRTDLKFGPLMVEGPPQEAFRPWTLPPLTEDPAHDASTSGVLFTGSSSRRPVPTIGTPPVDPESSIPTNKLPAIGDRNSDRPGPEPATIEGAQATSPDSGRPHAPGADSTGGGAWAAFAEAARHAPEPQAPRMLDPNLWEHDELDASFSASSIEFEVPAKFFTIEPQDTRPGKPLTDRLAESDESQTTSDASGSRPKEVPEWYQTSTDSMELAQRTLREHEKEREAAAHTEADEYPPAPEEPEGTESILSNLLFLLFAIGLVAGMAFIGIEIFLSPSPSNEASVPLPAADTVRADDPERMIGPRDSDGRLTETSADDDGKAEGGPAETEAKRDAKKKPRKARPSKAGESIEETEYRKPIDLFDE